MPRAPKPKSYMIVVTTTDIGRATAHLTYRTVLDAFAMFGYSVLRSYFARYGNPATGGTINVHVTTRAPLRVAQQVTHEFADAKVERRGDLSPLHALLMEAALHPDSADVKQVVDALHWFCNASGYSYPDEAMLAAQVGHAALGSMLGRGPQVQ